MIPKLISIEEFTEKNLVTLLEGWADSGYTYSLEDYVNQAYTITRETK